jgi:hypothetical protein
MLIRLAGRRAWRLVTVVRLAIGRRGTLDVAYGVRLADGTTVALADEDRVRANP